MKKPDFFPSADESKNRRILVVGLGNPGFRFRRTRHNAGFMAADRLASVLKVRFAREEESFVSAEAVVRDRSLILIKPMTYMNHSGRAVAAALKRYPADPRQVLVLCDDLNLPLGALRIRIKGSDGGQRGLASIIGTLGTREFPRIRIGIGPPGEKDAADFVLSRFRLRERLVIREVVEQTVHAVFSWISQGPEKTMSEYNRIIHR